MMVRQLASLLVLLVFLSVATAYSLEPAINIATRLVDEVETADAIRIAGDGPVVAYLFVKVRDLYALIPWLLGGVICALVSRVGIWRWMKPAADVEVVRLRDEANCTVEMWGTALSHDPGIHFLPSVKAPDLLPGATPFEVELLGVILAAGDVPFDVDGESNQPLAGYVQSAWRHIVEKHGAGSLASMLVIAHQVGKVLAFKKEGGCWIMVSDKFGQQSSVVVRRTRSFYALSRSKRDDLMQCLAVLATNMVPTNLPEQLHTIVRDVRIADLVPTTNRSVQTKEQSRDEIDIRKIATLVSSGLLTQFVDFNINQSQSKSEALGGLFMKKEMVLLVPPRQMREAFARLLPAEISDLLKLSMPTTAKHPSDPILYQVLEATGELVTVIRQVNATDGSFAVRSGTRKFGKMWAISTKNLKQDIVDAWGEWPFDIEVLAQGEVNAG